MRQGGVFKRIASVRQYKNHINLHLSRLYYLMTRHFSVICNIYGDTPFDDAFLDKHFYAVTAL